MSYKCFQFVLTLVATNDKKDIILDKKNIINLT